MKKPVAVRRGFVFVDVIIGMVILTVALVAIGGLYFETGRANVFADNRTIAFNWAQQRIENLKAEVSWRGKAGGDPPSATASDAVFNSDPPRPGMRLATRSDLLEMTKADLQDLPATAIKRDTLITALHQHLIRVTVRVDWQENGRDDHIELSAIIERD
ncbi:MAG TPA: hypothetical protein PKA10_07325 [Selenomonadales bacterium]|nr:hypothetical protein [Selenomonadales bacterium]